MPCANVPVAREKSPDERFSSCGGVHPDIADATPASVPAEINPRREIEFGMSQSSVFFPV